ncbi:MAG: extracellular solute-binding protein [Hyphomicrobiales bacterium]|nr:extracellular solute-binding protein [Hyphomicrobiales bacterium]
MREHHACGILLVFCVLVNTLASTSATAADPALVAAARKEGRVVWYTTLIVNQAVRPLKQAFERAYPGIELQYVRGDESPTAAKLLSEAKAGRVQADVFDGISSMVPLKRAGLVAPHVPPAAASIPADMKDRDGYWIAILLYVFAPGINTTLVPPGRVPKTYRDLLDPAWRGKMAWNPNSIAGAIGFVGATLLSQGEARGMEYLKALAAQRIVNVEASSRAILDQVIAGEYPMGLMMFNHHTVISAQKGAPSDWVKLEPVPVALDAVGILKDAPHPNAARLLVNFLTSEDGQRVLQKADYLPAMPSIPAMKPGLRPEDGGFKATYLRPDEIHDRIPGWIKIVGAMFR